MIQKIFSGQNSPVNTIGQWNFMLCVAWKPPMINLIENRMMKLYGIEIGEGTPPMTSASTVHSCFESFSDRYTELNTFTAAA